jgi:hypothetical protein
MVNAGRGAGIEFIRCTREENHAEAGLKIRSLCGGVIRRRQKFAEQAVFIMLIRIPVLRRMLMRMPGTDGGNGNVCSVCIKQEMQIREQYHRKAVEPA